MKLTFATLVEPGDRDLLFETCADELSLVRFYLRNEPHAFLHIGRLVRFIEQHGVAQAGKGLSIGLDIIKELYLARLAGLALHVVDLDAKAIAGAARIAAAEGLPSSYEGGDIFKAPAAESLDRGPYATLLLSQMDYCLSDEELFALFVRAAGNPQMRYVVVLSPSLFHWPGRDVYAGAKEAIRVCFNIVRSLVSKRRAGPRPTYVSYMRSVGLLRQLACPSWRLGPIERYDYPSGAMHLMLFERSAEPVYSEY